MNDIERVNPMPIFTPGIGRRVDWLNHEVSLADVLDRQMDYSVKATMRKAMSEHPYEPIRDKGPAYR